MVSMRHSICITNVLLLSVVISGILAISMCPKGWFETEYACFQVNEHYKTWFAAETECRNKGGYLATVNTSERHSVIQNLLHMNGDHVAHWIGGIDYFIENKWMWISNNKLLSEGFTYWYPGYPLNNNKSNCLALNTKHPYRFFDNNCSLTKYSICERPLNRNSFDQIIG